MDDGWLVAWNCELRHQASINHPVCVLFIVLSPVTQTHNTQTTHTTPSRLAISTYVPLPNSQTYGRILTTTYIEYID